MTELEAQTIVVATLDQAIAAISSAAANEQRTTHDKHICPHYRKVLDELGLKATFERAYLYRLRILGR